MSDEAKDVLKKIGPDVIDEPLFNTPRDLQLWLSLTASIVAGSPPKLDDPNHSAAAYTRQVVDIADGVLRVAASRIEKSERRLQDIARRQVVVPDGAPPDLRI